MDSEDERVCRICMNSEPILDWHEELFDFGGISYKECYYKYTQLEEIVSDPFSQLLCGVCSTDLQSFHLLMEKAIESQKIFEQKWKQSFECVVATEDDQYSMENSEIVPEIECVYVVENIEDRGLPETPGDMVEIESNQRDVRKKLKCDKVSRKKFSKIEDCSSDDLDTPVQRNNARVSLRKKKLEKSKTTEEITYEEKSEIGKTKRNTPVMCSYCSKIIHNAYYLKKHEETHKEDRSRKKVCAICGLKTFTSTGLYNHMKIHEKNREKKYKCEFCDKAFFDRGACNIHRRVHLGLMVKCPLCPKEYYRQVDLDKHMISHSHAPLHSCNLLPKKRNVVQCKECNKMVSSAKFNAHRSEHLNDPMMQCTLCTKDFFCRKSCTRHMQRVHKRTKDDYDDITMYYDKYRPRLSRVLREQQELVKLECYSE